MKPTFLQYKKPLLTAMIQTPCPEAAIETIHKAIAEGADAIGLQACQLEPQYQNADTYRRILNEAGDKPTYVTYYRTGFNKEKTDDELAEGLLELAGAGATLCDVMGDYYDRHPDELTMNPAAIDKQKRLIEQLKEKGAEVLMSSHVLRYTPAERVLEIAHEQVQRGADIVKIVTGAESMEQQIENLRIVHLLQKELNVPFLFLSGGECHILRRLGPQLGCCMYLCVQEHDALSTKSQPLLRKLKAIVDNWD